MPPQTRRSSTAGHFQLEIDGTPTTAYVKSVEGGFARAGLITEAIGPQNHRIKHVSTMEIEPMSVSFGLAGGNDLLKWVQSSWRKTWNRRNGSITHANFDQTSIFQHDFYDALLEETTFPTFDGSSKEPAYLKIKIQPQVALTKPGDGKTLDPRGGEKGSFTRQKMLLCSGFRFELDGFERVRYTNKIDSFTIKQGIKKFHTGRDRFPQIEPTKLEFPNITGTIAFNFADELIDWYHTYLVKGKRDPGAQKTGYLAFLAPNGKEVLFRLNMYEIGIQHLEILPATAGAEEIKRVKFELFIGNMDLDGPGDLGAA